MHLKAQYPMGLNLTDYLMHRLFLRFLSEVPVLPVFHFPSELFRIQQVARVLCHLKCQK